VRFPSLFQRAYNTQHSAPTTPHSNQLNALSLLGRDKGVTSSNHHLTKGVCMASMKKEEAVGDKWQIVHGWLRDRVKD